MSALHVGDVVQFNENHKWCGCFGYIESANELPDDTSYLIGVPLPESGVAFIFSMVSNAEFDYVGHAALLPTKREE